MRFILSLFIILLSLSIHAHSFAGEIYDVGEPEAVTLPTETEGYPDILTRQLKYRKSANEFREHVYERQQDFSAPSVEARANYEEQLSTLDENRGTVHAPDVNHDVESVEPLILDPLPPL